MKTSGLILVAVSALLLMACADDSPATAEGFGAPAGSADCAPGALIGDLCGGGIVASVGFPSPGIILVVADADEPGGAIYAYKSDTLTSSPASDWNDGRNNTGTFNTSHPASWACQQSTRNGYSDWYLPALNEWGQIAPEAAVYGGVVPGLTAAVYWTSTENPTSAAFFRDLSGASPGTSGSGTKTIPYRVRCIRRPF